MLNSIMSEIIKKLKLTNQFKQIEPYEGQFDNIDEFIIIPPAIFVELTEGRKEQCGLKTNVSFYLVTNHIKSDLPTSMLKLIDKLRKDFSQISIAEGILMFDSFNRLAIFNGFATYQLNFTHKGR